MTKKKTEKPVAVLTLRDGPNMTPAGRRAIAAWLERQKRYVLKHYKDLGPTFRARYLYEKDEDQHEVRARM